MLSESREYGGLFSLNTSRTHWLDTVLFLLSVYATTAANPHESSYACYYDEERDTYLGDWYSVNWMEDSDVVSWIPMLTACWGPRMCVSDRRGH